MSSTKSISGENPLGTKKISGLIIKYSIPAIISGLVSAIYNTVDQIFIGWGVGDLGMAATNVAFPFTTICMAMALLFGIGGSSRITSRPDKNLKKSKPVSKEDLKQRLQNKKIRGDKGEEIVVHIEKKKLSDAGRNDLAERVEWVSSKEDGHGYDIKSFEILPDGSEKEIVIEVKATSQDDTTPFYISLNELNASKEYGDSYYLYRIFNLDKAGSNIKYYVIQGNLEVSLNLIPVSFRAV